jgi:hypothetical protein
MLDAVDDAPPHGTVADHEVPVGEDGDWRRRRDELDDALAADSLAAARAHVGHDDDRRVRRQRPEGIEGRVHVGILGELGRDLRGERRQVPGDRGADGAIGEVVRHPGEDNALRLRHELHKHLQRTELVTVLGHSGVAPLAAEHRVLVAVHAHEHDGRAREELGAVRAGKFERGVVRRQHHLEPMVRELGAKEVEDERPAQQLRVVHRIQVLDPRVVRGGERPEDGVDAVLL